MADHAWCSDPPRDAAVRAAEDGRDRPLPTLKEAIATVTETMSENGICEEMQQGMRQLLISSENRRVNAGAERDAAIREREVALARVAELQAAQLSRAVQIGPPGSQTERKCTERERQAASGGNGQETLDGSTQAASGGGEGEPVAWGVRRSDGTWWESFRSTRDGMLSVTTGGGDANNVVSPLFDAPPQPRGWLTEKERRVLSQAADVLDDRKAHAHARFVRNVLARSTPPEVDGG